MTLIALCCGVGILNWPACQAESPKAAGGISRFIPWMARQPNTPPAKSSEVFPADQLHAPEVRPRLQDVAKHTEENSDAAHRAHAASTTPAITVSVVAPPHRQVGSGSTYRLSVRNTTRQAIDDVYVRAEFSEGLAMPGQSDHHVVRPLGRLAGKESRDLSLTLFGVDEGKKLCTFTVYAEGISPVAKSVGVEFVPRRLELRLLGPGQRTVGTRAEFTARLTNVSSAPINGLNAAVRHDACFVQRSGSAGAERGRGSLQWKLGTLKPGEGVQMQVELECQKPAEYGHVTLAAVADNFPGDEIEVAPQITAETGALALDIDDSDERLRSGEEMVYTISVRNRSRQQVRNVRLVADLPELFEPIGTELLVDKRALAQKPNVDGRMLEFAPIDVLPAGSIARYQLRVRAKLPGEGEFRARVTETTSQWTGEVSELTAVNP